MFKKQENGKPKDYKKSARIKSVIFLILAVLFLAGMTAKEKTETPENASVSAESSSTSQIPQELITAANGNAEILEAGKQGGTAGLYVEENGTYTDKDRVALYIHIYQKLPSNYITKTQARKKGWDQDKGNLWEVLPGMSIGGGEFRNEENKLPEKEGRLWKECDIDYQGGSRGGARIVYSDDGYIYYTGDHYNTFECLYRPENGGSK